MGIGLELFISCSIPKMANNTAFLYSAMKTLVWECHLNVTRMPGDSISVLMNTTLSSSAYFVTSRTCHADPGQVDEVIEILI